MNHFMRLAISSSELADLQQLASNELLEGDARFPERTLWMTGYVRAPRDGAWHGDAIDGFPAKLACGACWKHCVYCANSFRRELLTETIDVHIRYLRRHYS
jgi:hypothetical protein